MDVLVAKVRNFLYPDSLFLLMKNKETYNTSFDWGSSFKKRKGINQLASIYETICSLERDCHTWDQVDNRTKDLVCLPHRDTGLDLLKEDLTYCGQVKHYKKGSSVSSKYINRSVSCLNIMMENYKHYEELTNKVEFITSDGVKLSKNPTIEYDKLYHNIIDYDIVVKWLNKIGEFKIECEEKKKLKEPIILRNCQERGLELMRTKWGGNINLQMPTGSGKTIMMIQRILECPNEKFLILVPRLILLEQWSDELNNFEIEHSLCGVYYQEDKNSRIIVCVNNSFKKVMDFGWNYLIVDESHHIENRGDGEAYLDLIGKTSKIIPTIRLSATMSDKQDFYYGVREAITDKVLIDYQIKIPYFSSEGYEEPMIEYLLERPEFTSILCFVNSIDRAKEFNERLIENGFKSCVLTCEEKKSERKIILDDFKSGKIEVLVSINILSEGIDLPITNTILFLDKRSSIYSISQCIGRSLRLYPGKKVATIILPHVESIDDKEIYDFIINISENDSWLRDIIENKIHSHRIKIEKIEKTEIEDGEEKSIFLYEKLYNNLYFEYTNGNWDFKYNILCKFWKEKGFLPSRNEFYNEMNLGYWLAWQRHKYQKWRLSKEHIDKLNKVTSDWIIYKITWDDKISLLKEFYLRYKRFPKVKERYGEIALGRWFSRQKEHFRDEKLSKEREKELYEISPENDPWISDKIYFDDICDLLRDFFIKNNGRFPTAKENHEGINLGQKLAWIKNKYNNGQLSIDQINKLDDISDTWNKKKIKRLGWNVWCDLLKKFCESNIKNPRIPKSEEIFLKENIGTWIHNTKADYKEGKLSPERIAELDMILPIWRKGIIPI